ncbi:MAG TPA: glycoside hydrolase family 36 protein, partial [Candidatus Binataceae bacterium]|nr:glycoside hydrolase family 36 protein [Candidatus Binataceae bacterium]
MTSARIEMRYRIGDDARTLKGNLARQHIEEAGVALSVRVEERDGRSIVRANVSNRSGSAIRLDSVRFHLETGFPADAPARFFKHGYQSWSASHPVAVGIYTHRRDDMSRIARVNHQSEVVRPQDAPEGATSELFTIVESESSRERFLAGFIDASHQLTTITARTPNVVMARALFDDVILPSGDEREIDSLAFWRSDGSAAAMATHFAAMLGDTMQARISAPYQRGWCSWYHYFHAITEDAMRANLRALRQMRSEYPIDVVQLDDGYQAALGDWDRSNAKFPSGLKSLADAIREAGFIAGIWTAPFLAARDSRLLRDHEDWFIKVDSENGPLRAAYNPNWTSSEDKYAYALDPGHPAFVEHLERLFRRLVDDFGYEYLKLDFLYAGAAEGIRHDNSITRAQALRHGLQSIRRGAGERAFILGCGCLLGPAVGIVDGMRIGPDVAPFWGASSGENGEPGTAVAIDAILARSFMHRRWWLNDPDCLMLRAKETQLSNDEREALAWTIAASGGMLLISDDMSLLDAE